MDGSSAGLARRFALYKYSEATCPIVRVHDYVVYTNILCRCREKRSPIQSALTCLWFDWRSMSASTGQS